MSDHFNLNSKLDNQIQILNTLANKTIIYNRLQPGDIPILGVALKINQSTYSPPLPSHTRQWMKNSGTIISMPFQSLVVFLVYPELHEPLLPNPQVIQLFFFCGVFVNNSVYVWFTLWAAFVTITRCIGISLNPTQDIPVTLCFDKLKHKHLTQQR